MNHSFNNSFIPIPIFNSTPQLVREERTRIQHQQAIDHEVAMRLQREMEQHQQQQYVHQSLQKDHEIAMDLQREIHRHQRHAYVQQPELQNNENLNMNNSELRHLNMLNVSNMDYEELLDLFPNESHGANEETIQRLPTDTFNR
eukprot:UN11462